MYIGYQSLNKRREIDTPVYRSPHKRGVAVSNSVYMWKNPSTVAPACHHGLTVERSWAINAQTVRSGVSSFLLPITTRLQFINLVLQTHQIRQKDEKFGSNISVPYSQILCFTISITSFLIFSIFN